MDALFLAIDYREPLWLAIALVLGLMVRAVGLPPMIGFLFAGFLLNAMGAEDGAFLRHVADLGVTLLLFTIGLKLRVGSLLRPEIWAVAVTHMLLVILLTTGILLLLGLIALVMFDELSLVNAALLAFALSFSSTVFAVKTLEDKGATGSRYGRIAIGVLIMQDIAAVVFLAASTGKLPSIWALSLLLLIPARKPMQSLLDRVGHGELLVLIGFVYALGGAALFEMVNLKGDLGALVLGVLLGSHQRSSELARALFGFKELFLIGFFLSIGLTGLPTLEMALAALFILLLIPLKTFLFLWLFTRFNLTARTSTHGALVLSNYSEFGLIVTAVAANAGWLPADWLLVMALVLSASFVLAAPLNHGATRIYTRYGDMVRRMEKPERLPQDRPVDIGNADTIVFGVGRVGTVVFDMMRQQLGDRLIGVDFDKEVVVRHKSLGRNVVQGDVTNPDFWSGLCRKKFEINNVVLTMPSHAQQMAAVNQLYHRGFKGKIAATAKYSDEVEELQANGVEAAFDIYLEAGAGFADHVMETLGHEVEKENAV